MKWGFNLLFKSIFYLGLYLVQTCPADLPVEQIAIGIEDGIRWNSAIAPDFV